MRPHTRPHARIGFSFQRVHVSLILAIPCRVKNYGWDTWRDTSASGQSDVVRTTRKEDSVSSFRCQCAAIRASATPPAPCRSRSTDVLSEQGNQAPRNSFRQIVDDAPIHGRLPFQAGGVSVFDWSSWAAGGFRSSRRFRFSHDFVVNTRISSRFFALLRGMRHCSDRMRTRLLMAAAEHPTRPAQARMDCGSFLRRKRQAIRVTAGSPVR
jgi:hypothetical protein